MSNNDRYKILLLHTNQHGSSLYAFALTEVRFSDTQFYYRVLKYENGKIIFESAPIISYTGALELYQGLVNEKKE